jgi:hypothetical protein
MKTHEAESAHPMSLADQTPHAWGGLGSRALSFRQWDGWSLLKKRATVRNLSTKALFCLKEMSASCVILNEQRNRSPEMTNDLTLSTPASLIEAIKNTDDH